MPTNWSHTTFVHLAMYYYYYYHYCASYILCNTKPISLRGPPPSCGRSTESSPFMHRPSVLLRINIPVSDPLSSSCWELETLRGQQRENHRPKSLNQLLLVVTSVEETILRHRRPLRIRVVDRGVTDLLRGPLGLWTRAWASQVPELLNSYRTRRSRWTRLGGP